LTVFQETWFDRSVTTERPNAIHSNFLKSVVTTWRPRQILCRGDINHTDYYEYYYIW